MAIELVNLGAVDQDRAEDNQAEDVRSQ